MCDPASTQNLAILWYGDGASFSGYREEPVPVGEGASLYFRGARNLDASLDRLLALGLSEASTVIISGGSAGGLATFLHLDHYHKRITTEARADARVVGNPDCGFFLDHPGGPFGKGRSSYPEEMKYVFGMQAASGSLSPECQQALGPESWKCIMAPHAAPFIKTPWFAFQSRFDHWQLSNELFLPCMIQQPNLPPFKASTCQQEGQDAMIQGYGPAFMEQFRPLMKTAGTKNGAFLDACIIHGSTNSSIDGHTNSEAFEAWMDGGEQQWFVMECDGSDSAGPCDTSKMCAPFP
jgi:hypothetical protein